MTYPAGRSVGALTLLVASSACSEARAQNGAGAAGAQSTNMGIFANPYMNPYVNPFLNPYATNQQMSPGNAALFFFGAQSSMGGIGSGQLSGVRPGPRTPGQRPADARPSDDGRQVRGVPSSVSRYCSAPRPQEASRRFLLQPAGARYYSSPRR